MKNTTMRSMIAVAALAVAASSVSAQTYKADVPMAFRAGSILMPAGAYDFTINRGETGVPILHVHTRASSKSALLLASSGSDAPKAWRQEGNPKITFECVDSGCRLSSLWDANGLPTYQFPAHKLSHAEKERAAVVTVGLTRTE